jgi:hypothetical protein
MKTFYGVTLLCFFVGMLIVCSYAPWKSASGGSSGAPSLLGFAPVWSTQFLGVPGAHIDVGSMGSRGRRCVFLNRHRRLDVFLPQQAHRRKGLDGVRRRACCSTNCSPSSDKRRINILYSQRRVLLVEKPSTTNRVPQKEGSATRPPGYTNPGLNLSAKKSLRSESYAAISIVDNADSSIRIKGLYDALHMATSDYLCDRAVPTRVSW